MTLEKSQARVEAGKATSRLNETKTLWPAVNGRVDTMRRIREENHLADVIRASLGGGRV